MATRPPKQRNKWSARRKAHQRRTNTNQRFYNSTEWRRIRRNYITRFPLCVQCQNEGRVKSAEVVDHKIPINKGGDLLNENNFQSLCHVCHNKKSGREAHQ